MKLKILLKIAFYIIGVLVFQELVLRICFPLPELSNFDRINYMKLAKLKHQYKHLRNQNWYWQSQPDTNHQFLHEMNTYSFRDVEWPIEKTKGKKRVLFIGDSFIEGIMAGQDHTIPKAFARLVGDKDYEVWNGGMMGAGLGSYLMLAADASSLFKPDYVFLCISGNDLSQKMPVIPEMYMEAEYFNPWKPRLLELIQQIRVGSPIKFRWMNNPQSYLPTQEVPSSPWHDKEAELSPHVTPEMKEQMKKGLITPFRTNNLYNEEKALSRAPVLGETIPFFQYICKKFGAQPIVVYIPSRSIVTTHYYQYDRDFCLLKCADTLDLTQPKYLLHQYVLAQECARYKVPFINLTQNAKAREKVNDHIYWNYDDHMRGKGYKHMGAAIYSQWQALAKSNE